MTGERNERSERIERSGPRTLASASALPHIPALDGLRALAVLGVVLYHAAPDQVPGGFLGVEVFFVLSGYLIAALLLAEFHTHGRIDLPAFWARRIRRLVPALLVLVVTTLASAAILVPDQLATLRAESLAALVYLANWQLVYQQVSYFESIGRPPLLQHLWSLGIEGQFYLLWPPLLLIGLRHCPKAVLLAATLVCAATSALLMASLYQPDADPSRVYYGTDTRAAGLLAGVAVAFISVTGPSRSGIWRWVIELVGIAALCSLGVAGVLITDSQPLLYRGGFALIDLLTALILINIMHPRAILSRPLGLRPLRWLGERSYSVYLWHWPIFELTRPQVDVPLGGWPLLLLRLVATGVLAELSYRLVEKPLRRGALERSWASWRAARGSQRRWLTVRWSSAAAVLFAGLSLLGTTVAAARPPDPPAYLAVQSVDTWELTAQDRALLAEGSYADATEVAILATSTPVMPAQVAAPTATSLPSPSTASPAAATLVPAAPTSVETPASPQPTEAADAASPVDSNDPSMRVVVDAGAPASSDADAPAPGPVRITAMGDSVMLGTLDALHTELGPVEVSAAVGRQAQAGIQLLQARAAAGSLGDVVIVHLGTNGTFTPQQFDQLMTTLADVRRVVIVNVKVPRVWEGPNNAVLAAGVQRWPNAVLVDWHAASNARAELFYSDGFHLRAQGAALYASLIAAAVASP